MRVAVDIGGTFTDVVVFDEAKSELSLAKTLSTPAELARGVLDGLIKAAVRFDAMTTLIHGSTVVVNAVIERKGAKTALVTTKGFRDVYEIGRINRPESFNPRFRKHRPLVPREDIFEVTERRLADGSVRTPFDENEAREVARIIKEEGFEASRFCFCTPIARRSMRSACARSCSKPSPRCSSACRTSCRASIASTNALPRWPPMPTSARRSAATWTISSGA